MRAKPIFITMKPIIEYKDYHSYIKDFYEDRKRFSYFSWREFAKLAGFSSPTYLRLVSEGFATRERRKKQFEPCDDEPHDFGDGARWL